MSPENSNKYPLISVVTVNYNHSADTIEFLESLMKSNYKNLEIIVVDNGSEPGDAEKIRVRFKDIYVYRIEKNIGFAPANNLGIKQAKGDYILSINNDMVVTENFLLPLLKTLQDNPEIGIVCPKIYFYDDPQNLQYAGYTEINPITIRNEAIGYNEIDRGQYDKDSITAFAHGGAILFSSQLLKTVGQMSEYFFLYYEDMDWCKRIRNAGYKICFVHNSVVYHKDAVTTVLASPSRTYYMNRGRLIYMRRHIKFPMILLSLLYLFVISFPKNIIGFVIQKDTKQMKAYSRAFGWFIRHFFDKEMIKDTVIEDTN